MDDHPDAKPDATEESELPATLFDDQLDASADEELDGRDDGEDSDGEDAEGEDEVDEPRHNALPRRVESWRSRTASGAVMSAMAMGLRQVFEPERRKPAIIAEAPSDPYDEDDPIVVDYVADDASGTKVILRPWLMQAADPTADAETAPAAADEES